MAFLVAYGVFEIPSNYFLKKTSPSTWIAFLMLAWGSLTIGVGGVQNFAGVTTVRFLLGTFEAGKPNPRNYSQTYTHTLQGFSRDWFTTLHSGIAHPSAQSVLHFSLPPLHLLVPLVVHWHTQLDIWMMSQTSLLGDGSLSLKEFLVFLRQSLSISSCPTIQKLQIGCQLKRRPLLLTDCVLKDLTAVVLG